MNTITELRAANRRIEELEAALIGMRRLVTPMANAVTERYRDEYEACVVADAALGDKKWEKRVYVTRADIELFFASLPEETL
jgi:hypothetical protein